MVNRRTTGESKHAGSDLRLPSEAANKKSAGTYMVIPAQSGLALVSHLLPTLNSAPTAKLQ